MNNILARFDPGDAATGMAIVFVAQTSLVILAVALFGRAALRRRAEIRHGLWLAAFCWVALCPVIVSVVQRSRFSLWSFALPLPAAPQTVAEIVPRSGVTESSRSEPLGSRSKLANASNFEPQLRHADTVVDGVAIERGRPLEMDAPLRTLTEPSENGRALVGALALVWLSGIMIGLVRVVVGLRQLARIARSTRPADCAALGAILDRVRSALGVTRLPQILDSPIVGGPMAFGLFRPRIVLPHGLVESISPQALHHILIHECAHVVRHDLWVGLCQRVVGALLWPHLLVHYLNGQLSRAREEVCDNYVLRCGESRGYARTLLDLTERCQPAGAVRPGLGLLGARWTLADRVAGVLDPRRNHMTRMSMRTKIATALVIGVMGISVSSVRLDAPARGSGLNSRQADPAAPAQPIPTNAVWRIDGAVVDEAGVGVRDITIHGEDEADAAGARSAADGKFTLWMNGSRLYSRGLVAKADDGARIGVTRFRNARALYYGTNEFVTIKLKPARAVTVRVKDATGSPVPGAEVEALDVAWRFRATSGPLGLATLRVAADSHIGCVIGHKPGVGCDYFENYRATPPSPDYEFPALPAEITLALDGAQKVTVKTVDSQGQPIAGALVAPIRIQKPGKVAGIFTAEASTTKAVTDASGTAVFDWLPRNVSQRGVTFTARLPGVMASGALTRFVPSGPPDITVQLVRPARLSGVVHFPDGRPARGIMVMAGHAATASRNAGVLTGDDGRFVFEGLEPDQKYMASINDAQWAATSAMTGITRDGQQQRELEFTLAKGTRIHGRVTEGSDARPVRGALVSLSELGEPLPKEQRTLAKTAYRMHRGWSCDNAGGYEFRVGPGRYTLEAVGDSTAEPVLIEVKNEEEIVRDVSIAGRSQSSVLNGVVVERTPTGDRPIDKAWVFRWPVDGRYLTDEKGRFQLERDDKGALMLYAFCPGQGLAGFASIAEGAKSATLVVSRTGTVTGRVVDSDGKPWARQRLRVEVSQGAYPISSARFAVSAIMTDDEGRFIYKDAPVGSSGQIAAFHRKGPDMMTPVRNQAPRTVVEYEVRDLDPVQVPDLVIPVGK